ncbi:MAG TPA: hypothetical protein VML19_05855 [Verrucomicrobiae bacterium]|nr:hypothetical protein [Verrucomicrobiae bacterium]
MRLVIFFLAAWLPQRAEPSVEEILAKIQTNTSQFLQSLPDFVCDETITSKAVIRGRQRQYVNESHFVGRQQKQGRMTFTETREVISINGKAVPKNTRPQGPIFFGGGFSSVLHTTFGKDTVAAQTYKVASEEEFRGRPTLVIEFSTRPGQQDLRFDFDGKAYVENDRGKAWIDKESMRILRLEREYLNVPRRQSPMVATVEYGEAQIGGQAYWMPVTVTASQVKGSTGDEEQYVAQYRNYRKFEAQSSIIY